MFSSCPFISFGDSLFLSRSLWCPTFSACWLWPSLCSTVHPMFWKFFCDSLVISFNNEIPYLLCQLFVDHGYRSQDIKNILLKQQIVFGIYQIILLIAQVRELPLSMSVNVIGLNMSTVTCPQLFQFFYLSFMWICCYHIITLSWYHKMEKRSNLFLGCGQFSYLLHSI